MAITVYGPAGVNLSATHDEPKFKVGTVAHGDNGTKWMYVKANSAVAQYMWVGIAKDFTMNPGTKSHIDGGRKPGLAQVEFKADEYGWVALAGGNDVLKVKAKTGCLPSVALYTSGTAGFVDDTSGSQTLINGIVLTDTATSSGAAEECFANTEIFPTPTP
jgi:hypothetical protein